MFKKKHRGFTLVEILVSITIIFILLSIVMVAINPSKRFAEIRDAKRKGDIITILNAIARYAADNKGALPLAITTTAQNISKAEADLCSTLVTQYIVELPVDPAINDGKGVTDCSTSYDTGYTIVKSMTDNRITVTAPSTDILPIISFSK